MSRNSDDLNINIKATDHASPTIDKVAKDVAKLEGKDATVDVKANASQAESRLDAVLRHVKDLDSEDAEVILKVEAGKAEAEIRRLTKLLASVDGEDAVAVITARDQASDDLDRIQAELNEIDGRSAEATVSVKTTGLDKLEALAGRIPGIGSALSSLGGAGAVGAGAGMAAAAAAAYTLAQNTARAAIEVGTLASLTGAAVEDTSRLSTVWSATGADVKDLADVIAQVNGVLATTPELASKLGISLKDANPQEVFLRAVDALNKLGDSQQRLVLGSQLFGEEGVRQVGAVVARYGDLRKAMADVPEDALVSAENVRDAREFEAATGRLTRTLSTLGKKVGGEVVPVVADLADALGEVVTAADKLADIVPGLDGIGDVLTKPLDPLKNWADGLATAADGTNSWTDRLKGVGQTLNSMLGPLGQFTNGIFDVKDAADQTAEALPRVASESDRLAAAFTAAGSEIENQATDAADAVKKIGDAYDAVRSLFDARISRLDLEDQFDSLKAKAVDAWTKTAEGADDAGQAQRDYQREILQTQSDVATYAEQVLKLPPDKITKILADIEEGSVQNARNALDALESPITVGVFVEMHAQEYVQWANSLNKKYTVGVTAVPPSRGPRTVAPPPAPTVMPMLLGASSSVETVSVGAPVAMVAGQPAANITNVYNLPNGYDESRIIGQIAKWTRRNGNLGNAGSRS